MIDITSTGVMSEDALIRRTNLRSLCHKHGWGPSELASLVERKPNYISDLLAGQDSKGKKKSFGEKIARHIEACLQLPRNWLDTPHGVEEPSPLVARESGGGQFKDEKATALILKDDAKGVQRPPIYGDSHPAGTSKLPPSDATNDVRAPVIEWARLGLDLTKNNDEVTTEERRHYFAKGAPAKKVKCIRVHDNSLYPDLRQGDMVFLDPENTTPGRDKIALFVTPDGEYLLRRYRPLIGGDFEAYDSTTRSMTASMHGIVVVAALITMQRDEV